MYLLRRFGITIEAEASSAQAVKLAKRSPSL
jgi:hypothetical protein